MSCQTTDRLRIIFPTMTSRSIKENENCYLDIPQCDNMSEFSHV